MENTVFIQYDGDCFDANSTLVLGGKCPQTSATVDFISVGYLEMSSIVESDSITSAVTTEYAEVPFCKFKTVSDSNGIDYKSNSASLKTSLIDYGNGRYIIPLERYPYTGSLFNGFSSGKEEFIFSVAMFMKDHGHCPVIVLSKSSSDAFVELLGNHNIAFI